MPSGSIPSPPWRQQDFLRLVVPVLAILLANLVGVAFAPTLVVKAPLLLVALSPLVRHLVLVASGIDPWAYFVIGALRLFAADPFVFVLGRRYGPRALAWLAGRGGAGGELAPLLVSLFGKASTLIVLVNPDLLVCTLAGVSGMTWSRFLVVNALGTFGMLTLVRVVGRSLEAWIAGLLGLVTTYMLPLTVLSACLAAVGGLVWWRRFRRAGGRLRGPTA